MPQFEPYLTYPSIVKSKANDSSLARYLEPGNYCEDSSGCIAKCELQFGHCRLISVRSKVREFSYLSFRSPELGQPFWSTLPLVVAVIGVEVSNPNVKVSHKSDPSVQSKLVKRDSRSTFSEEEIRARAYQIYEFRGKTDNHADEDWSQAEAELMEHVGGK